MNKIAIVYVVGAAVLLGVIFYGSVSNYKETLTKRLVGEVNSQVNALTENAFKNGVFYGATAFTKFQSHGINSVSLEQLMEFARLELSKAYTKSTNDINYPVAYVEPTPTPVEAEIPDADKEATE